MNANFLFDPAPTKGEQARHKLLLAALEKIGEKGYDGASVRDIASAAGQNVAAISYYFGNKEKLYEEVLDGILGYIWKAFGGINEEATVLLQSGKDDPDAACKLLQRMLTTLLMENIERAEIGKLRNVIMREQAKPSTVFNHLYENGLNPLHRTFTQLLAMATGLEAESTEAVIRTHALFGQVMAFNVARATILRRLGLEKLERKHGEMISAVVDEHIELICKGLQAKGKAQ
ncbi:transcriptional regulator CecR [Luteolibacter pohnpeiensis]|uniref:Transcriptional regulator CecR n=1 Tax=Luteolibacter pohnpeiensis TaxID=454153 RepID=A0A934S558_9BACT|nr:transcriptional regulator CecR [Luteolibacter pohnpeiensis]MBK1881445.1 transcriptional regulator CecR [Luteolibacter pohnpeiensis]